MSNVFVNDEILTAIANVIRSKNSTENTYKPAKMAGAVAELPSYDFVKNLIERPSTATEIVIPDYITAIGNGAFSYSPYLTSITIPNSVTNIGIYAFLNCSSLTSITIPDSVTNIGGYAFNGCKRLKNITIPNSVTNIGGATFGNCSSLTSITIPDSVTNIGIYAFQNCKSLTSITIPNSVTNIGGYAFNGCEMLEFVKLGQGFNANNLDLSASTKYTRETIVSWINAFADRTGMVAYKLIIGPANLKKLTKEDIAIATAKNLTIA